MFEIVAGELRAKLGAVSAMRQVRSGRDTCAVATGPGRATSGRPTLQTSSNQRNSNRLTRTPVTNVVNPSPKTTIFSEKAIGLTTFVTTDQKSTGKTPPIDDVCNNTQRSAPRSQHDKPNRIGGPENPAAVPVGGGGARPGFEPTRQATQQHPSPTGVEGARGTGARLRCPWAAAGPGRASSRRAKPHASTPGATGVKGPGGIGGPGCGARGRRRGQGGPRDRPLRAAGSCVAISRAGRRPPAHTAARPHRCGGRRRNRRARAGFEARRRTK